MFRRIVPTIIISLSLTPLLLLSVQSVVAQVRTSTSYQLQSDSINFGGGFSSSTNFQQESTFGEVATGDSGSATYQLRAGYQQMQEVFLSLTPPSNVELTPNLPGITGGTSNGSTTVTVTTDSPAGYSLTLEASDSPAMRDGSLFINDHTTSTTRDLTTPAASATFGFSVFGTDATADFLNNGSACGSGTNVIGECWRGLTVAPFTVAERSGANHPSGSNTVLYFRVGIESGAGVLAGIYTATTTLTAFPL